MLWQCMILLFDQLHTLTTTFESLLCQTQPRFIKDAAIMRVCQVQSPTWLTRIMKDRMQDTGLSLPSFVCQIYFEFFYALSPST
jgi:hypothetical protein